MRRTWVDLIREERDHPERERERWCGGCAVWRLAAGAAETEGERELGPDVVDGRDASAARLAAETHEGMSLPNVVTTDHDAEPPNGAAPAAGAATPADRKAPPAFREERRPDPSAPAPAPGPAPASAPLVPGSTR